MEHLIHELLAVQLIDGAFDQPERNIRVDVGMKVYGGPTAAGNGEPALSAVYARMETRQLRNRWSTAAQSRFPTDEGQEPLRTQGVHGHVRPGVPGAVRTVLVSGRVVRRLPDPDRMRMPLASPHVAGRCARVARPVRMVVNRPRRTSYGHGLVDLMSSRRGRRLCAYRQAASNPGADIRCRRYSLPAGRLRVNRMIPGVINWGTPQACGPRLRYPYRRHASTSVTAHRY